MFYLNVNKTASCFTRPTGKVNSAELAALVAATRHCTRPPSRDGMAAVVIPRTITQVSIYAYRAPATAAANEDTGAVTVRAPVVS